MAKYDKAVRDLASEIAFEMGVLLGKQERLLERTGWIRATLGAGKAVVYRKGDVVKSRHEALNVIMLEMDPAWKYGDVFN